MTIMVVDDSETCRALTRHMLAFDGHNVVEAADGRAALQMLKDGTRADMILLDLNMPRMTGIQFLEAAAGFVENTPVFVVSVSTDRRTVARVKALGARGFFAKPLQQRQLERAIGLVKQVELAS